MPSLEDVIRKRQNCPECRCDRELSDTDIEFTLYQFADQFFVLQATVAQLCLAAGAQAERMGLDRSEWDRLAGRAP